MDRVFGPTSDGRVKVCDPSYTPPKNEHSTKAMRPCNGPSAKVSLGRWHILPYSPCLGSPSLGEAMWIDRAETIAKRSSRHVS